MRADQHLLPACFLGRFSTERSGSLRDRAIWVGRLDGGAFKVAARYAGRAPRAYDFNSRRSWSARPTDKESLDTAWKYEPRLPQALAALEDSTYPLDGRLWAEVLVPFVSSLFIRTRSFQARYPARMPGITGPGPNPTWQNSVDWRDNTLSGAAIEWQRLLAPTMAATWTVFHGPSLPLMPTNDVGYCLMNSPNPKVVSYAFPISPHAILALTRVSKRFILEWNGRQWTSPITHLNTDERDLLAARAAIRGMAETELYGPTQESVTCPTHSDRVGPSPAGPGWLVHGPGRSTIPYLADYFRVLTLVAGEPSIFMSLGTEIDWTAVARHWELQFKSI